jgi:predicted Fe-Mo cluster-binding NifX family protein
MKIAVTSDGRTAEDSVNPRFGRAPFFVIVDADSGEVEAVNNSQNLDAPQGAGIQAARTVAEHGAEVVIPGHCGPKAFRALSAAGIKVVVGAAGSVADSVKKFKDGELKPSGEADVEGHWA